MITVSTLSQASRSYHHGDLRSALIEAGLDALRTGTVDDLGLRRIARTVGVSATAVYRHFEDKNALLTALAAAGIERLGEFQSKAVAEAFADDDALALSGRAYVRFALANPALFRLMFTQLRPAGETVFGNSLPARMLQTNAAALTADRQEASRLVVQAWAMVHGLAMLMLDGHLPIDDALIDRVICRDRLLILHGSNSEASP